MGCSSQGRAGRRARPWLQTPLRNLSSWPLLGERCPGLVGVPSQVSFWALGAVTKPALLVGAGGQACLRGTRGQLSGPCLGGLASQPRAAWEGSRPCRLPENALGPAPTISLPFCFSGPPSRPKCGAAPCPTLPCSSWRGARPRDAGWERPDHATYFLGFVTNLVFFKFFPQ